MNRKYLTQQKQELLIKEYEEIGQAIRNDEQLSHQWTSVLLPIAVGTLVLPFTFWEYRKIVIIFLIVASVPVLVFLIDYCFRLDDRIKLRVQRAKEIEDKLGFHHYLLLDKKKGILPTKQMWLMFLLLFLLIWSILYLVISNILPMKP